MTQSRRAVLQASIAAVTTTLGGCLGSFDTLLGDDKKHTAGTLVIRNTHTTSHEITILATEQTKRASQRIAYKNTFRLNPNEKVIVENFLTGTDAYTITVTLDGIQVERFKYSPVGEIGRYLEITIPESENIVWVSKSA